MHGHAETHRKHIDIIIPFTIGSCAGYKTEELKTSENSDDLHVEGPMYTVRTHMGRAY